MKITLKRSAAERERYYRLELIANLFGEFLLIRTFGACINNKPSRIIRETYTTFKEAKEAMEKLLHLKSLRGYHRSLTNERL